MNDDQMGATAKFGVMEGLTPLDQLAVLQKLSGGRSGSVRRLSRLQSSGIPSTRRFNTNLEGALNGGNAQPMQSGLLPANVGRDDAAKGSIVGSADGVPRSGV